MNEKELIKTMDIKKLPNEWGEMAQTIGLDAYIDLVKHYGGSQLYIPTLKMVLMDEILKRIISEYNGFNKKELIRKYGISEATFYRAIRSRGTKSNLSDKE